MLHASLDSHVVHLIMLNGFVDGDSCASIMENVLLDSVYMHSLGDGKPCSGFCELVGGGKAAIHLLAGCESACQRRTPLQM